VFVQDPADSRFASLPEQTVSRDHPDRVLPLAQLAAAVADAVRRLSEEVKVSENGDGEMRLETEYGTLEADALERDAAVEAQEVSVETALWTALRALQERAQLSERLAERVGAAGAKQSQARFEEFAREAHEQAEAIRGLLVGNGSGSAG